TAGTRPPRPAGSPGSRPAPYHPAGPSARRTAAPAAPRTPAPSSRASSTRAAACLSGTARPAARRAGSPDLLRQLEPFPARVVHVAQPHRAPELEDRPPADTARLQPLTLRFDVPDVDHRDPGLVLGLRIALGERDLGLVTVQRDPGGLVRDKGLREAE